jgi:hypothetical protein
MDATNQVEQPLRSVKRGRPAKVAAVEMPVSNEPSASQIYAERIWAGQSPDLPVSDRIARIHAALTAQGMDTNVTLP